MKSILEQFYTAFQNGDARGMAECYHEDIQFEDPGFGQLNGKEASKMWEMLLKRSKGNLKIDFKVEEVNDTQGKAYWEARYPYGKSQRPVHNKIHANFEFKDGKIIKHTDEFDLWKWSSQALGLPGQVLGWSSFFRNSLNKKTKQLLKAYMESNP